MAITPVPGVNSIVVSGGVPVVAVAANPSGGRITNPLTAADQGLTGNPKVLFVDAVNPATTAANGTTFALQPGESWDVIPGQTTTTSVNATDSGHKFSVISYN